MENKRQLRSASKNEGTTTNTDVPKQHHPTFYALIVEAITNLKQPKGCSRRSILKYIFANNKLKENRQNKISLTETIQRSINSGSLVHVGNTSFIKLTGTIGESRKKRKHSGKTKESPILPREEKKPQKLNLIKVKRTTEETNKKQQVAKKRATTKRSDTVVNKKPRKYKNATGIRHLRGESNASKQKEKNAVDEPKKGRRKATKSIRKRKKDAAIRRKDKTTTTEQVDQKTKKVNTNSQRKTVMSIGKTEIGQRSKIGSKTGRCRVPNSLSASGNLQLQTSSGEDLDIDSSAQNLYVKARIFQKFSVDTKTELSCGARRQSSIYAIAVANDGRKLIAQQSGLIQLYSPDFKLLSCLQLKNPNPVPYDIAIYSDNEAIVTTGQLIYLIDFSRNVLSITYTFFDTPYLVSKVTSCRDDIYVTCLDSSPSVTKIDSTGSIYWNADKDEAGDPLFERPYGITSYSKGENIVIVVTDDSRNTLTLLDGDTGEVLAVRKLTMSSPRGCTADTFGNIYLFYVYPFKEGAVCFLSADLSMERILSATKTGDTIYPEADSYDIDCYPVSIGWDDAKHQLLVAVYPDKVHIFEVDVKDK